ncbi:MAG: mechanosensitive ion channel domain-containing protein [Ginsengibacter sp.]
MNEIVNKLNEYYKAFLQSIPRIGLAILIIIIGVIVAGWLTGVFKKRVIKHSRDALMGDFLAKAVRLILIICILLLALQAAGLSGIAGAIMATAGASAVVLGFAFKDIAENFLAGIILAFNRPFNVDDTVQIESISGKVTTMEFRYTKILTFDGRNVYIPNADVLTKPVINFTENGFYRNEFIIGISSAHDIEKAKQIIMNCIKDDNKIVKDDVHINFVVEDELAGPLINLKVLFWVPTDDFRRNTLEVRGAIIQKAKKALEQEAISLPVNITEFKLHNNPPNNPMNVNNDMQKI